jgi:predicted Rdx family selenoprotein
LAATIKNSFGTQAVLKKGHGGIFKVSLNGEVIFDNKKQCGRLPTDEEILRKIGKNTLLKDENNQESDGCCNTGCG